MDNNNRYDMDELDENFTLESILAEYKGNAFIDGDKKTPSAQLDADADRIISEVNGYLSGSDDKAEAAEPAASAPPEPVIPEPKKSAPSEQKKPEPNEPVVFKSAATKIEEPEIKADTFDDDEVSAEISSFFDEMEYSDKDIKPETRRTVEDAIQDEEYAEKKAKKGVVLNIFSKKNRLEDDDLDDDYADELEDDYDDEEPEPEPEPEDDYIAEDDEPDYQQRAQDYAARLKFLGTRGGIALILSLVMIYVTVGYSHGWMLLTGLSYIKASALLGVLLLCVMATCYDIIVDGILDIFSGQIGGETLASASAVVSVVDVFLMVRNGCDVERSLPFCAVGALSLVFALWGRKLYYNAMKMSLRTACMTSEPMTISIEHDVASGKSLIQKYRRDISGFYNRLAGIDCCENAYSVAAPLLILASLIFAALCSVVKGESDYFLMFFAAMLAISASFTSGLAYVLPFSKVTKRITAAGSAVAGWTGASSIAAADGAVITDTDIFPDGTLSISGVKIVEGTDARKIMSYTASLIAASGSGLAANFQELLKSQGCQMVGVDNFSCYDGGGIGAVIGGDKILVGSSGFMNLMGIRLPQNLSVKSAVFTAVNDELCGIFSVNYVPVNSVQDGLVTLLKNRIKTITAARDFNITPLMIQQKFKISVDSIEYISLQDSFRVLGKNPEGAVSAVMGREGVGCYSEAVVGGKLLRRTSLLSTIISIIGAALGLVIVFMLCWTGAIGAVSADNILLFMLCWTVPVLLISGMANKY